MGTLRFSEYRNDDEVWQHILRLREFYDVGFYQTTYNTETSMFYFNIDEDSQAIVEQFLKMRKQYLSIFQIKLMTYLLEK